MCFPFGDEILGLRPRPLSGVRLAAAFRGNDPFQAFGLEPARTEPRHPSGVAGAWPLKKFYARAGGRAEQARAGCASPPSGGAYTEQRRGPKPLSISNTSEEWNNTSPADGGRPARPSTARARAGIPRSGSRRSSAPRPAAARRSALREIGAGRIAPAVALALPVRQPQLAPHLPLQPLCQALSCLDRKAVQVVGLGILAAPLQIVHELVLPAFPWSPSGARPRPAFRLPAARNSPPGRGALAMAGAEARSEPARGWVVRVEQNQLVCRPDWPGNSRRPPSPPSGGRRRPAAACARAAARTPARSSRS